MVPLCIGNEFEKNGAFLKEEVLTGISSTISWRNGANQQRKFLAKYQLLFFHVN